MGIDERGIKPMIPLYSVGTWDTNEQAFTAQGNVPSFNLTLWQLKDAMRLLRSIGYSVHRYRDEDGGHEDNDVMVLIERTDGMSEAKILESWQR